MKYSRIPSLLAAAALFAAAEAPTIALAQPAPASMQSPASAPPDNEAKQPIAKAEKRIRELHDRLGITEAQEPQWKALVEVMRDNAQQMSAAIEQREQAQKTVTALDDLKAYEQIADAHADGLKKLIPAFEALYSVLSDSQKKVADDMFRHEHGRKA